MVVKKMLSLRGPALEKVSGAQLMKTFYIQGQILYPLLIPLSICLSVCSVLPLKYGSAKGATSLVCLFAMPWHQWDIAPTRLQSCLLVCLALAPKDFSPTPTP